MMTDSRGEIGKVPFKQLKSGEFKTEGRLKGVLETITATGTELESPRTENR